VLPPGRPARIAPTRPILALIAALAAIALAAAPAQAKRVICIDGAGDAFLSNAEGYYRASPFPSDVISVGGNLTDCMGQVEDGDVLYIVTHGGNNGASSRGAASSTPGSGTERG